jgi:cellulose synthase/poly-beta-1,6-N-acetylglucosamine synthase-like glycosyltransferase
MKNEKLTCSVGVMAHNEEKNIALVLHALLLQSQKKVHIDEIIVISSGSTDKTNEIAQTIADKYPKVKLIIQNERKGKSSAINLFLREAKNDLLVIESADTIPSKHAVEKLVNPLRNPLIGMTGGRPTPMDEKSTMVGFAVHLLWDMHHQLAKYSPKLGEMIAFRRVFKAIPPESAVDEASIEALVKQAGLQCLYVADAIVYNRGPKTLCDFIKQRKRIAIGHLWLSENQKYQVSSNDPTLLLNLFIKECLDNPSDLIWIS